MLQYRALNTLIPAAVTSCAQLHEKKKTVKSTNSGVLYYHAAVKWLVHWFKGQNVKCECSFLRFAALLRTCCCHCFSPILPTIVGLCLFLKKNSGPGEGIKIDVYIQPTILPESTIYLSSLFSFGFNV